jgi:L-fucose isomerase-like protein
MVGMKRGTVKIKPVYLGIPHYRDIYGSVCSADVVGTPPIPSPAMKEMDKTTQEMIDAFKKGLGKLDFVEIEKPLIVKEHIDLRRLPPELSYDTDALMVAGGTYLERYTVSQYNLPIIDSKCSEEFLRGLRVKKYLKQSKFLYIGEIPSFSAPYGPYDFPLIEKQLGVRVRHIETNEFFRWFDRFSEKDVERELKNWEKDFDKIIEPDHKELMNATRAYMALKGLCEREDANGLTVNCGRFTEERPVVPCLAFARLIDEGIMCSCEGDITAMLSSLMIHAVSGQSMLMGNFGSSPGWFEAKEGEITIEHDIIPISMASTGFTVRDYHGRKFGVTGYATIKKEPMTLLNMDKSLKKISVIEGKIKNSVDGIHCRVIVHMKVDGDVNKVPEIIVGSQHVSMTFGRYLGALKQYASLAGIEISHL